MKKLVAIIFVALLGYLVSYYFVGKAKGYSLIPEGDIDVEDFFKDIDNFFEHIGDKKISQEDSLMAADYFQQGMDLYLTKDYENAKWYFYDAYSYNPTLFEALYLEGKCDFLSEDYYSSFNSLEELTNETSDFDSAYYYMGFSKFELENYPDAIFYLEIFLEYQPNSVETLTELGWAYYNNYQEDEAIENVEKSLEIDKKNIEGHFLLGYIYANNNNYKKSIYHNLIVLNNSSNYYSAAYNVAYSYENLGKRDSAYYYLEKSLEIKSDYSNAYGYLSELYYKDKLYNKSIESANNAILINNTDEYNFLYRAKSYFALGNFDVAFSDFEAYYDSSYDCETLFDMATCQYKLENKEDAISYYTDFLSCTDDDELRAEALQKLEQLQN